MHRRDLLKAAPAALATVAATPALASEGGESSGGTTVNLLAVALPIVVDDRIQNYVFTTFRLHLSASADVDAVKAKEAWFRDAMVRAGHRRSFAVPGSLITLDEAALVRAMQRAAHVLVGDGPIEHIEVASQVPRRRSGLS